MSGLSPMEGRDLDDEIRHHLSESADLLMTQGWDEASAGVEAERRFGDPTNVQMELMAVRREAELRMKLVDWARVVAADARYALRGMRASPTFSLSVIITLALGIGAAASVFAVLDAQLLRPLPYEEAPRWVVLTQVRQDGGTTEAMWGEAVRAWQTAAADVFDGWVGYGSLTLVRVDGPQAEALSVVAVTPGAEHLLGIPLHLGRGLMEEDGVPGAPAVAILGRAYWDRIGADPDIIGRTIRLESGPVTVVGVLRGGIRFPLIADDRDMWLPLRSDFTTTDRSPGGVQALWARLVPGLSLIDGQARIDVLAASLAQDDASDRTWEIRLVPVGNHRAGADVARAIWTLTATVGAILLIALLNGVNLVLVRASARRREMAVRIAIGGSRYAILRQLLVEGLLLGMLGGAAALGLTWLAVGILREISPASMLFFSPYTFTVENRTLSMVFGTSMIAGTLLGLVPGLTALRGGDSTDALIGRGVSDTRNARRARSVMVVTQVALSMTLLTVAGLLMNSLARLLAIDEGFEYQRVAIAVLMLSPSRYPDGAARETFVSELEARLEVLAPPDALRELSAAAGPVFHPGPSKLTIPARRIWHDPKKLAARLVAP